MKTILVVDDDPAFGELYKLILKDYAVITATDAAEAIDKLIEGAEPDLAIVDVRLTGLEGKELRRVLAQMRPGMKTALTSGTPTQEVQGGVDLPFLEKPFGASALVQFVENLIGKSDLPPPS